MSTLPPPRTIRFYFEWTQCRANVASEDNENDWLLRVWVKTRFLQMVSVERVIEYTKLQSEEDMRRPHEKYQDEELGAYWPEKGGIEFENVFVKYKDVYVLKDLTFNILPGQKVEFCWDAPWTEIKTFRSVLLDVLVLENQHWFECSSVSRNTVLEESL